MKKLFSMLAVLLLSSTLHANSFNEGEHYEVIGDAPSTKPQVMEFFSYFCPHCYNFEPIAKQLKAQLPADVPFKRSPVAFMGREMGPELQKAFALAEILKVDDKITPALFAMIHQKRTPPRNREEVKSLFTSVGVSAEDFDSNINSMPVLSVVAEYDSQREKLDIRSVPAFVVNNRYLVKVGALKSQEQFNALITHLLSLPNNTAEN